jgi:hypothetical protein
VLNLYIGNTYSNPYIKWKHFRISQEENKRLREEIDRLEDKVYLMEKEAKKRKVFQAFSNTRQERKAVLGEKIPSKNGASCLLLFSYIKNKLNFLKILSNI